MSLFFPVVNLVVFYSQQLPVKKKVAFCDDSIWCGIVAKIVGFLFGLEVTIMPISTDLTVTANWMLKNLTPEVTIVFHNRNKNNAPNETGCDSDRLTVAQKFFNYLNNQGLKNDFVSFGRLQKPNAFESFYLCKIETVLVLSQLAFFS